MSRLNDTIVRCYENSSVIQDIYILLKLIVYTFYTFFEVLIKNLIPANYLNKNVRGDTVLITGAGRNIFWLKFAI